MTPDDPRHGTENGYGNLKCRCPECRDAWRIAYAARRAAYRARPWPKSVEHGTYNAYVNYGCRCDDCRAANSAYGRDYHARTKNET